MWKTLWPILVHRFVLLALAFIAAKYVSAAGVAEKLMRGDTVTLWAGAPAISIRDIENYLTVIAVPALISIGLAFWARIKAKFALIVASGSAKKMSATDVKQVIAETSTTQIIQVVNAKT